MRFRRRLEGKWAVGFLVGLAVVVRLLPSEPLDPGGLIQLQKIGSLFVALGAVQLLGAFLVQRMGTVPGRVLSGFLSGFVSSTAYTLRAARKTRQHPEQCLPRSMGVVAASASMVVEAAILVAVADMRLFLKMAPALAAFLVAQGLILFFFGRKAGALEDEAPSPMAIDLLSQLQLTLVIGGLLALTAWGQAALGGVGLRVLTFVASLFELHGTLVANTQLASAKRIPLEECAFLIDLGLVSGHFSKALLAVLLGAPRFKRDIVLAMAFIIAVGGAVSFFF